jgi:hypothetical protein
MILANFGMAHLVNINRPTPCNLTVVKDRTKLLHTETWKQLLGMNPKLRTYVKLKHNFDTETYVSSFLSRHQRGVSLAHHLPALRICKLCDLNTCEDEQHFLCSCPRFKAMRLMFSNSISILQPEFETMNEEAKLIFCCTNRQIQTSKFISQAWKVRTDILYKQR